MIYSFGGREIASTDLNFQTIWDMIEQEQGEGEVVNENITC